MGIVVKLLIIIGNNGKQKFWFFLAFKCQSFVERLRLTKKNNETTKYTG